MSKESKAKENWDKIRSSVAKIRHALIPDQKLRVDSVRVHLENDLYLQEITSGKQIVCDVEYQMLFMTPEELEKCKLHYDNGALKNAKGEVADTAGMQSKMMDDGQAFVMSKDGDLYVGTHTGELNRSRKNLSHASFLGGRPAEMAGMIGINDKGKIVEIRDISGHYRPEALDMYRGIKALEKTMPGVFDKQCRIYFLQTLKTFTIQAFLKDMEKEVAPGQSKYDMLRAERITKDNAALSKLTKSTSPTATPRSQSRTSSPTLDR